MRALRLSTVLIAITAVTACQFSVKADKGATAPKASTGFLGIKKSDLDIKTPKAFAGTKAVAVGSFKVGFVEAGGASAKASGFGGRSSAKVKLIGIDDATRQKITDTAYEDFLTQLESHGYTVSDRAALLGSDRFSKAKTIAAPYRTDNAGAALGAEVVYFQPSSFPQMHLFLEDGVTGFANAFGFGNPSVAANEYASKSGAKVLVVTLLVDVANADTHGGRFTSTSAVKVGQGLSVKPGSGIALLGGGGGTFQTSNGTVRLGQPQFSTETFGEMVDVTSGAAKSVELASNVASALLGGGTNISRKFELRADPVKFTEATSQLLKNTNGALVNAMAELR